MLEISPHIVIIWLFPVALQIIIPLAVLIVHSGMSLVKMVARQASLVKMAARQAEV